jgi:AcrR family transcriptional regulator
VVNKGYTPAMARPAYTRLANDERRRSLLARAVELFAVHGYDELTMAAIAREAGISKPLLYHYFRSKRDLFEAALAQAAEELLRRLEPDPSRPPGEQLVASLDAFLGWIESDPGAYEKLMRSAGIPEVRELIDRVREDTAQQILTGLLGDAPPPPAVRAAVRGWLWFMDGVCLDWVAERDLDRDAVRNLLLASLGGTLAAAGVDDLSAALSTSATVA